MAQLVVAPNPWPEGRFTLFMAGSIDMGSARDWFKDVVRALEGYDVLLLNPKRDDWDSSWEQTKDDPEFRAQVEWERKGLDEADFRMFNFEPDSKSPITIGELGEHIEKPGAVACPPEFYRKGNIDIMCEEKTAALPTLPTFEQFVKGNGGSRKLVAECNFSDYEKSGDLTVKEALEVLHGLFDTAAARLAAMQFPVEIYRSVSVPNGPEDLRTGEIGTAWSLDVSGAKSYYGEDSHMTNLLLVGRVQRDAIDWNETLLNNINPVSGEDEQEITLHQGARIMLREIHVSKQGEKRPTVVQPPQRVVTAATQPVPTPGGGYKPWNPGKFSPNWQPVPKTITETDDFLKWFGGSKVIDAEGQPLVCYHGSMSAEKSFTSTGSSTFAQLGHWFDADPGTVHRYTSNGERSNKPNMLPVFLSIQNPKIYPSVEYLADAAQGKFGPTPGARMLKLRRDLRKAGFDGVLIENSAGGNSRPDYWVAFEQKQIKSATGNTGEFSRENPVITASTKPGAKARLLMAAVKPKLLLPKVASIDGWLDRVRPGAYQGEFAGKQIEVYRAIYPGARGGNPYRWTLKVDGQPVKDDLGSLHTAVEFLKAEYASDPAHSGIQIDGADETAATGGIDDEPQS